MDKKICIVKLDTDDSNKISEFRKLWNELKADVVFVPKNIKFIIKGNGKDN